MGIHVLRYANVSKQAMLLVAVNVGPLKWRICRCDLCLLVHEGMNNISNIKVQLNTCSGNANIGQWTSTNRN